MPKSDGERKRSLWSLILNLFKLTTSSQCGHDMESISALQVTALKGLSVSSFFPSSGADPGSCEINRVCSQNVAVWEMEPSENRFINNTSNATT